MKRWARRRWPDVAIREPQTLDDQTIFHRSQALRALSARRRGGRLCVAVELFEFRDRAPKKSLLVRTLQAVKLGRKRRALRSQAGKADIQTNARLRSRAGSLGSTGKLGQSLGLGLGDGKPIDFAPKISQFRTDLIEAECLHFLPLGSLCRENQLARMGSDLFLLGGDVVSVLAGFVAFFCTRKRRP